MLLCSPWQSHLESWRSSPSALKCPKHTCHGIRWSLPEALKSFLCYALLSLTDLRCVWWGRVDPRATQHPRDATENLRSSWSINPEGFELGCQAIDAVSQSHLVPLPQERKNSLKLDYCRDAWKKKKTWVKADRVPRVKTLRGHTWNAAPRPIRLLGISNLRPAFVCLHWEPRNLHRRALSSPRKSVSPPTLRTERVMKKRPLSVGLCDKQTENQIAPVYFLSLKILTDQVIKDTKTSFFSEYTWCKVKM